MLRWSDACYDGAMGALLHRTAHRSIASRIASSHHTSFHHIASVNRSTALPNSMTLLGLRTLHITLHFDGFVRLCTFQFQYACPLHLHERARHIHKRARKQTKRNRYFMDMVQSVCVHSDPVCVRACVRACVSASATNGNYFAGGHCLSPSCA